MTDVGRQLDEVVFDGDVPAAGDIFPSASNVADFPN